MKKAALLVSLLLTASPSLAQTSKMTGEEASKVIREGKIIALELTEPARWLMLVDYEGMLFFCAIFPQENDVRATCKTPS